MLSPSKVEFEVTKWMLLIAASEGITRPPGWLRGQTFMPVLEPGIFCCVSRRLPHLLSHGHTEADACELVWLRASRGSWMNFHSAVAVCYFWDGILHGARYAYIHNPTGQAGIWPKKRWGGELRAGLLIEGKINEKKRNEKTKNRTKEYVSFIGRIIKLEVEIPIPSVFTFRFF